MKYNIYYKNISIIKKMSSYILFLVISLIILISIFISMSNTKYYNSNSKTDFYGILNDAILSKVASTNDIIGKASLVDLYNCMRLYDDFSLYEIYISENDDKYIGIYLDEFQINELNNLDDKKIFPQLDLVYYLDGIDEKLLKYQYARLHNILNANNSSFYYKEYDNNIIPLNEENLTLIAVFSIQDMIISNIKDKKNYNSLMLTNAYGIINDDNNYYIEENEKCYDSNLYFYATNSIKEYYFPSILYSSIEIKKNDKANVIFENKINIYSSKYCTEYLNFVRDAVIDKDENEYCYNYKTVKKIFLKRFY